MKDNKGFVELEGRLTSLGKMRVLENNFDITKFSVSDDGINYRLIDENLIDPYLALERSVLFNKNNDSNAQLKNRITIDKPNDIGSSKYDFKLNTLPVSGNRRINPIGFRTKINYPIYRSDDEGDDKIQFNIVDSDIANEEFKIEMVIDHDNIPFKIERESSPISVTLHNAEHFDIRLKEAEKVRSSPRHFPEKINWGSSFEDSVDDKYSKSVKYPKVITTLNGENRPNKFVLIYRGTFKYDGKRRSDFNTIEEFLNNTKIHNTFLTIRCELTGKYQNISLQLVKTESKTIIN